MRLIRRKLWRAFPELDSFDDTLCQAFVRVAASSWRARAVRQGAVALIAGTTIALAIVLSAALYSWRVLLWLDDGTRLLLMSIPLTLTLAAGFLTALLVRDRLLLRRVRAVLRDRGGCPHCGYRLLGVPVDAELRVVCPECGNPTVVDAAMGELVAGAAGQQVFSAVLPRIDERGRRRRRRVIKTVAWGGGSILTLLLLVYGLWWVVLLRDARAARAERDGAARWRELIAAVQPIPGSLPPGVQVLPGEIQVRDCWPEFEAAVTRLNEATYRFIKERASQFRLADGSMAYLDLSVIGSDAPRAARGQSQADAQLDAAAMQAMARVAVAELEADGVVHELSRVRHMSVVMRPAPQTDSSTGTLPPALSDMQLSHLSPCRQAARLSVARMSLALEESDLERYIDALDTGMAVARILDTGSTLIERMVGTAVESLMIARVRSELDRYPTLAWTEAVTSVLERRRRTVGSHHTLRGEQHFSTDTIKWFFAQPDRVQRAALLGNLGHLGSGTKTPQLWRLGTYRANLAESERLFTAWSAHTSVEPWLRPAVPAPIPTRRLTLLDSLTPAFPRFVASDDQALLQRRELDLRLAIRRYEQRSGRPPERAEDLVPAELPTLPLDPYTGRPLVFKSVLATGNPKLAYQIGPDPEPERPDGGPDGGPGTASPKP